MKLSPRTHERTHVKYLIATLTLLLPAVALADDAPKTSKPWSAAPSSKPLLTEVKASPEVLAYLNDISSTYQNLKRYQFEGTLGRHGDAPGMEKLEVPFRLAADKPRRARTEIRNPNMHFIAVTDSEQMWVYLPQIKQYTQQSATTFAPGATTATIGQQLATGTPIERYLNLTKGLKSARILRDETIDVGGRKVACRVVEAQFEDPQGLPVQLLPNKLWVEKATKLVVRDSLTLLLANTDGSTVRVVQGTIYTVARANAPIPDSLFAFKPPPGAQKVDQVLDGRTDGRVTARRQAGRGLLARCPRWQHEQAVGPQGARSCCSTSGRRGAGRAGARCPTSSRSTTS